ncbi:Alpha/Beta hydrolase protein [Aspergillus karnatakaensis]|uniref:alpha/beta hydrolase n=1 Tax=Aspergillus karnatakaensis TaxID=1810916 RepID=UPI003CCD2BA8
MREGQRYTSDYTTTPQSRPSWLALPCHLTFLPHLTLTHPVGHPLSYSLAFSPILPSHSLSKSSSPRAKFLPSFSLVLLSGSCLLTVLAPIAYQPIISSILFASACRTFGLNGHAAMASRWWLYVQAWFWRVLMRLGMVFHKLPHPRPPSPSFSRSFPSGGSKVVLEFYCPPGYHENRKEGRRLPVLMNFHGGGFTLGAPSDDSRWAQSVLTEVGAVVVSVGYRRAPEHPFPAAVDDGVAALQYLATHASELGLDVSRIALSGFSAGGNLAVTVPLRLRDRLAQASQEWLSRADSTHQLLAVAASDLQIVAIFSWYPILDFNESRAHRRAESIMPNKTLPEFFTSLFDNSYVPNIEDRRSPYASPVYASDNSLREGLPNDIYFYMCEWDMLLNEGQLFCRRLQDLGKHVRAMMVEKARHAWDKSANPFRDTKAVNVLYADACADMKNIFGM